MKSFPKESCRTDMEQPETLVLTEQQQKRALSGKKNKKRGRCGHTVFASPYDPYWPALEGSGEAELNKLLLSVLQPLRKPTVKVNWSEFRKVPRNQRRERRQKLRQEDHVITSTDRSEELRKYLKLGVNAVTRGLESVSVGCVLLAQDADPKMLISHIPTMCGIQGVPVLIMPALRSITETALGFSCIALGIKRSALELEGSHFHELYKAVSELCDKIPVPAPLPSFCYALTHVSSDEEADEPSKSQPTKVKVSEDVYKYRSSRKERVFVPGSLSEPQSSMDFLSLDMDNATNSSKAALGSCIPDMKLVDEPMAMQQAAEGTGPQIRSRTPEFYYQPLRLKQTVPNPKKIRKKGLKINRK